MMNFANMYPLHKSYKAQADEGYYNSLKFMMPAITSEKPKLTPNAKPPVFNTKDSKVELYKNTVSKIDPSKTKEVQLFGSPFCVQTVYSDSSGKELMRVMDNPNGICVDLFSGNNTLSFVDKDKDGNIDKIYDYDKKASKYTVYNDIDDDGVLDEKIQYDKNGEEKKRSKL